MSKQTGARLMDFAGNPTRRLHI